MDKPHVKIVDDDPAICSFLCAVLEEHGLHASYHTDATSALLSMSGDGRKPDVLVLDVHMPDVSGLGVLHILSETERRVPTLLITGMELPEDPTLKERLGFSDHLEKPFGMDEFMKHITALLPAAA